MKYIKFHISIGIGIGILICLFAPQSPAQNERAWIMAEEREDRGYDLSDYTLDATLSFSYGDETFTLERAPLRKQDQFWVPAASFLRRLAVMFIKVSDDSFTIISDEGRPLTLTVGEKTLRYRTTPLYEMKDPPALIDGIFFMSLDAMSRLVMIPYSYDAGSNTVHLTREAPEELTFFTVEKPKIAVKEVPKPAVIIKPRDEPKDIRNENLPSEYNPDVRLSINNAFSYLLDEAAHNRIRLAEWDIGGTAFGYTVDGHFRIKDRLSTNKERFVEDGEFLGFYKDDLWFKFLDNDFAIEKLRSQSQFYFGGEVQSFNGPLKSKFVYGEMDNTVTGPAAVGAVKYFGKLYSVREEYTHQDLFRTAGTFIFIENEAETRNKVSTTDYPRENVVLVADTSVNMYDGLTVDYTHAFSRYRPDNRVNAHLFDDDWRAAFDFKQDRYSYKMSYEHVGEQYVSVSVPSAYQDYEGWDFSSDYRFTKNWLAYVEARAAKNNVERDPRIQTNFDNNILVGSSLNLPWRQSISTAASVGESIAKGGDQDTSGTRTEDFRIDYSKGWGNMTLQVSFDHFSIHPFLASAVNGSVADFFSASLFNYYPELLGSYLRLYQSYRKTKSLAANSYTLETFDTTVAGRLNLRKYLSVSTDLRLTTTRREQFADTGIMTLTVGGEFKESPVTTFNLDFTMANWDYYDRKSMLPKNYTALFRVNHSLEAATPEKWGKVRVFMYRDLNSNGRHDEGEPGVPNARVYIVNGRAAFTDKRGIALIKQVVPGDRQAKVDITKLPLATSVRGLNVTPVTVTSLKTVRVAFPIVKTGTIMGRVYLDEDGDGAFHKRKDTPLPNVRIFLEPGGRDTLTFSDGTYLFAYAYPGNFSVNLDPWGIPKEYTLHSPNKVEIELKEGGEIKGVDFLYKPRPVKIEVFD